MFSWLNANISATRTRLLWDETAWSTASAFGIFLSWRSGQPVFAIIAAAVSCWAWVGCRRKYRTIIDLPSAKLSSAPQGTIEVSGIGQSLPEYPVLSPLSLLPCLWYEFKVEQGRGKQRRITQQGTSDRPFALHDGDQHAMVLPQGAQVISKHIQKWRRGDETCTETVLLKSDLLFVWGEYVHDWLEGDGLGVDQQANALLQEWKDDQAELKSRFDADGDGVINSTEWQAARNQAQQDVITGKTEADNSNRQCIRKPRLGGAFIISNYSSEQLAKRFRRWSWLHFAVLFAALLVAAGR